MEVLSGGDAERRDDRDARDGEDMKVHYMRMSPHEVQARCVMRTRSSTEGVSELLA